ncbi:Copper amine oxidase N-terminal domain-containing protein [Paenibacillus sp. 1_12]|uniref:stalk domain-containing protein n=1 Tax=Paenibacillus sp. 1_12 TaxID=1566278 RepID=UPI0008EC923E|nr:Copper amine oxidase N-terminal domain-containing protein [Paenibacillus sp. 1_12]
MELSAVHKDGFVRKANYKLRGIYSIAMVPFRYVSETLGANVTWNKAAKTFTNKL